MTWQADAVRIIAASWARRRRGSEDLVAWVVGQFDRSTFMAWKADRVIGFSMPIGDPADDIIKRLSETYRSVRLGRGVVGKTGQAMLGLLAMWSIIVWQLSDNIMRDASLIVSGLIATGIFWWWSNSIQRFAKENPAQALLEGAELLEYQKFEAQIKGFSHIEFALITSDPNMPQPSLVDSPIRPDVDG